MIKEVQIFNETIPVKNYLCTSDPNNITKGEYQFNLYIKITDYCNARCKFCSNQSSIPNKEEIDLDKLEIVLKELYGKNLLSRVSITGGEPLLYIDRLNKVLNKIFEINPDAFVTINTNGINFNKIQQLDSLSKLEGIHISRHHYDDSLNDKTFGVKTATMKEITELYNNSKNKQLIRLNCLLIKDMIDNQAEVVKYLEHASQIGVFRVGFVSLMPSNDYCIENFINFNDIFKNLNKNFLSSTHFYDSNICECCNGIYLGKNGNLVEYYARMTKELNCDYMRQLVYTPSNELSVGFNKKKILIPDKITNK